MYNGILSLDGNPIYGTYSVAPGNALVSLKSLGIPVVTPGGQPSIGVFITVETNAARISYGAGNGALGHVIASAGSIVIHGVPAVANLLVGNSASGSATTLQVTPYF